MQFGFSRPYLVARFLCFIYIQCFVWNCTSSIELLTVITCSCNLESVCQLIRKICRVFLLCRRDIIHRTMMRKLPNRRINCIHIWNAVIVLFAAGFYYNRLRYIVVIEVQSRTTRHIPLYRGILKHIIHYIVSNRILRPIRTHITFSTPIRAVPIERQTKQPKKSLCDRVVIIRIYLYPFNSLARRYPPY